MTQDAGESFHWSKVFDLWAFVEADFDSEYRVRLEDAPSLTWRAFRTRLFGLLATDSRLARAWHPPKQAFEEEPETEFS